MVSGDGRRVIPMNEPRSKAGRDLQVPGGILHCLDSGREGHPVLLIHGYGDSSATWQRTLPALVDAGCRPIAVDLPGLGRSSRPARGFRWTVENLAAWCLSALDALEIPTCSVVGHSMGGAVALHLCATHPDRFRRGAFLAPVTFVPRRRTMATPGLHRIVRPLAGRWLFRRALRSIVVDRATVTETLVAEFTRIARRPDYFATLTGMTRDLFSPEFRRLCADFEAIETRSLVLWGENDPWLPIRRGRALVQRLPDAEFVALPRCGHLPHLECPDEVNHALITFVCDRGFTREHEAP